METSVFQSGWGHGWGLGVASRKVEKGHMARAP